MKELLNILLFFCFFPYLVIAQNCCNKTDWKQSHVRKIIPETFCGTTSCVPTQAYPPAIYMSEDSIHIDLKSSHGYTCSSPKWDGENDWECKLTQLNGSISGGNKYEESIVRHDNGVYYRLFGMNIGGAPTYTKYTYLSTSTQPSSGFVVQNGGNAIIGSSNIPLSPLGETLDWSGVYDLKKLDGGGLIAYVFLYHNNQSFTKYYIGTFVCPTEDWVTWTFDKWILSGDHMNANFVHPCGSNVIQGLSIFYEESQNRYIALTTVGCTSSPNGDFNDPTQHQRSLYWGFSDDPYDFKWVKKPLLSPFNNDTSTRVYAAKWHNKNDEKWWLPEIRKGQIQMVFSGTNESQTPINSNENKGQTWLWEVPQIGGVPCCDIIESDPSLWVQGDFSALNP